MQTSFILPANGAATPKSIERKRKMAEAMMAQGMDTSPVGHWTQGAARMANALVGGMAAGRADRQEAEGSQSARDAMIKALNGGGKTDLIDAASNPFMSNAGMSMIGSQWDRMNQPPPNPGLKDMGNGQFFQYDERDPSGSGQMFTPEGYQAPAPEPTSGIQDYEYYRQSEMAAGRQPLGPLEYEQAIRKSGATSINNTVGGETLTPGWKKVDENYANEYVEWRATGGFADIDKQLGQLDESLSIIEQNPGITGPAIGNLPDWAQAAFNPDGTIAREYVEEVVQRNLRVILGAQFTEREGERLIARAYNPRLPTAENAKRVRRLITQIKTMAQTKEAAANYFEEKGTLMGFQGKVPTNTDLNSIDVGDGPAAQDGGDWTTLPNGVKIRKKLQ